MKLFIFLLGFFLSLQDSFAMTLDDAPEGKPAANPSIPRIGFRYLDKKEEDLFTLSTHFPEQVIEAYDEDLSSDANKSLQTRKQGNPDITKEDIVAWSEKYQHLIDKKPENAQGLKEYFWEYYRMISSVAS